MPKPGFTIFLFFCFLSGIFAQSKGNFQWVLPLQSNVQVFGSTSPGEFPIREGKQVFLVNVSGERKALPYDSMAFEQGKFWRVWKNDLQGMYHLEKGEIVAPLFDYIQSATTAENNWAYLIQNYGMYAVINDRNLLLLPYQKAAYGRFTLLRDTILGYLKHDVYNFVNADLLFVSRQGATLKNVSIPATPAAEFQRISANQYVFSSLKNGKTRRDTFAAAEKFVDNVALVRRDTLWGYFRSDGTWLLPPRYQAATVFDTMGYAVVKSRGKYGVIKKDGTFQVPAQWAFLKPAFPGFFEYKENGKIGIIDQQGKTIIPAGNFSGFKTAGLQCITAKSADSLLIFRLDGTPLDIKGVVDCTAGAYQNNFGVCIGNRYSRKWGVLQPDGQWSIEPTAGGRFQERKYFYIAEAVPNPCCLIGGFNTGVSQPGKQLLFDTSGKLLLDQTVDDFFVVPGKPYLLYKKDGKWGLIASADVHIPASFDEAKVVGADWIFVRKADQWGVLKWSK